ncbi:hypothetical protein [Micromonospora sicca]|nr:hypothetical protein [Micromonospora sp. 4G53]
MTSRRTCSTLGVTSRRDCSRLGCQIEITDALDGLTVEVPPTQS